MEEHLENCRSVLIKPPARLTPGTLTLEIQANQGMLPSRMSHDSGKQFSTYLILSTVCSLLSTLLE